MREQAAPPGMTDQIEEFLRWWKYELSLMQPKWLKALVYGKKKRIAIMFPGDEIQISYDKNDGEHTKNNAFDTSESPFTSIKKELKRFPDAVKGLRLSDGQYFRRTLTLPNSARFKIDHILALDLERSTPFQPGEIYSEYFIEKEEDDKLHIVQLIVKRHLIDTPLQDLERHGITVDFIDAADADKLCPVDFLSNIRKNQGVSNPRTSVNRLLAVTAACLGCALVYTGIERQYAALNSLSESVSVEQKKARIASAKRARVTEQQVLFTALHEKKFLKPSAMEIWEELAKRLPDSAWVSDLKVENSSVQVTGFADNAEGLIKILDQSPLFDGVSFFSPVTMDRARKKERFRIKFTLANRPGKGSKS